MKQKYLEKKSDMDFLRYITAYEYQLLLFYSFYITYIIISIVIISFSVCLRHCTLFLKAYIPFFVLGLKSKNYGANYHAFWYLKASFYKLETYFVFLCLYYVQFSVQGGFPVFFYIPVECLFFEGVYLSIFFIYLYFLSWCAIRSCLL